MNPDNGYAIITIDYNGEPLTVVGTFPPVTEGETISLVGEFVVHPKFGRQFKVSSVNKSAPESEDSVIRFLSSGLIKGLGPKTAFAIVNRFGKRSLDIIENDFMKLSLIKGITPAKAQYIRQEYLKNKRIQDAVMFLQNYGITTGTALKIYKIYGENTIADVQKNPYRLIEDIDGIGFLTADRIAANMGIRKEDPVRIRAAVLHVLGESSEKNGNTYLPAEILREEVFKLIECGEQYIGEAIDSLIIDGKIKQEQINDTRVIFSHAAYRAEKGVADQLLRLLSGQNRLAVNVDKDIEEYQKIYSIKFNDAQVRAVKCAVSEGVSVITGGPGTGKTTVIKCIIYLAERLGQRCMLMAPTGRAAKRMTESTGHEASTVHRALMTCRDDERNFRADVIIVDETSMVDVFLMNMLLNRVCPPTRLVLVGDKDQLPSVGAGNVLSDIMGCGLITCVKLDFIYRQTGGSLIVENAHKINIGEMPVLDSKNRDFFYLDVSDPEDIAKVVLDMAEFRLPKYLNTDSFKIQVLCPMKNGAAGVKNLNALLQNRLNPSAREGIKTGEQEFRNGDKVMHTVNNYSLEWKKYDPYYESGEGVFNGDMGVVEYAEPHTGEIKVIFDDGKEAVYSRADIDELALAYAVTVHKSQGSEFDAVIIPITAGSPKIMTRNLLYTAITRAKKLVMLIGGKSAIKRMVDNNFIAQRYSALKFFILEAEKDFTMLYST